MLLSSPQSQFLDHIAYEIRQIEPGEIQLFSESEYLLEPLSWPQLHFEELNC